MGFELVGQVWDADSFKEYVAGQDLSWAQGVTMHHTAYPDLAMRPHGFKAQHIRNMRDYYRGLGWRSGPHLFIDEDQIWGMSSLERRGVHAVSFNATHLGIEVLGNYDGPDSPSEGRGEDCWRTARDAVAAILGRTGWGVDSINGHRDDPRTSKTCPGSEVDLAIFRAWVSDLLSPAPNHPEDRAGADDALRGSILDRVEAIEWQLARIRAEIK